MSDFAPREHVPLAGLTTLGVGGPARWFIVASSVEDVVASCRWSRERGVPLWLLGGGSNVVIADAGFDGLVLRVAVTGTRAQASADELRLEAGAGEPWDGLVARTVAEGWAGAECLSGIPGSVGGTPIQNVGAYGQEVASIITDVDVIDVESGDAASLDREACGFSYRHSRFRSADAGRFVVTGVRFRFTRGAPTVTYPDLLRRFRTAGVVHPGLQEVRAAVLEIRRSKGMVADGDPDARSVGSFFMNPVIPVADCERLAAQTGLEVPARPVDAGRVRVPAAWLIERAGWARGDGEGAVGLSPRHPLAIVNRGGARAADVVRFAARVKRRVAESFGVWLQPEPVFAGFDPAAGPADLEYLRKAQP